MDPVGHDLELIFDPLPSATLIDLVRDNVIGVNLARTGIRA
jgi:hypothetical protein